MIKKKKGIFTSFVISRHEEHGKNRESEFERPIISPEFSSEHMFYVFPLSFKARTIYIHISLPVFGL